MALRMHPRYEAEFRSKTHGDTKMANVSLARFICKTCQKDRPLKGRKSLGRKAGFQCAVCSGSKD